MITAMIFSTLELICTAAGSCCIREMAFSIKVLGKRQACSKSWNGVILFCHKSVDSLDCDSGTGAC
jgi:hypothetical protein